MDLHRWIVVLRLPIEIAAAGLAVAPALLLLRAWSSLPEKIPVHFGPSGRPDRWGGRFQAWLIPVLALGIYGMFSTFSGTWTWLLGGQSEPPRSIEPLLLIRIFVELLMTYVTWGTIRVARKESEGLDWRLMWGLILLAMAPAALIPLMSR